MGWLGGKDEKCEQMGILCNRGNLMKRERHKDWGTRWFKRYSEVRQMDLQEGVKEGADGWSRQKDLQMDTGLCSRNASVSVHIGHVRGHCPH